MSNRPSFLTLIITPLFYLGLIELLLFSFCGQPPDLPLNNVNRYNVTEFWVSNFENNQDYLITAQKIAEGTNAVVYLETGQEFEGITADEVGDLVISQFDSIIYPRLTTIFGYPSDIDNNGKVTILLLDIKDGYPNSNGFIAGYFSPTDTFTYDELLALNLPWKTNAQEMLYLDINPTNATNTSEDSFFYSTAAHEFYHMISFNQKVKKYNETFSESEESWVDEGMAEVSTDLVGIFGDYRKGRLKTFQNASGKGLLSLFNDDAWILDAYAISYMFFRFLGDNFDDGNGSYYSRYSDNASTGIANVKYTLLPTGISFKQIFKDWLAAIADKDSTVSHYYTSIDWTKTSDATEFRLKAQTPANSGGVYAFGFNYYLFDNGTNVVFNGGSRSETKVLMIDKGDPQLYTELSFGQNYTFIQDGTMILINTDEVGESAYIYENAPKFDTATWSPFSVLSSIVSSNIISNFNMIDGIGTLRGHELHTNQDVPICGHVLLPATKNPDILTEALKALAEMKAEMKKVK